MCAALASPVPQQRYTVRRPQNAVNLHNQARQLQSQFNIQLDDSGEIQNLQGLGSFASSQVGRPLPSTNIGGNAQFNVRVEDDSIESDEVFFGAGPATCPEGQLPHGNRCVVPRINRNIFVFGKEDPPEPAPVNQAELPLPQLDYNIIFVRSRPAKQRKPVIIPPPQKKTVVYVLEDEEESNEKYIEVDGHKDADPEVYYVKVRPGENPQLPGGIDLQTAYSQAIRPLQGIDDDFDSSIELTIGGGGLGGNVGVPLPQGGGGGAGGFQQGGAGFGSNAGFDQGGVGVALPGAGGAGGGGFGSGGQGGFDGGAGFGGGFDAGGQSFDASLSVGGGGGGFGSDVGVGLPGAQGGGGFQQTNFARSQDAGVNSRFNNNIPLEVDIDDGRIQLEPASQEIVQQALRYNLPANQG